MIEREDFSEAAIARRLTYLLLAILVGFGLVALALTYWSVVRTEGLAARPDNPRTVEAELRVQRGSIVDRNNVILAENSGPANQQERLYPIAEAGPAVGHYSLRFGTAGVEQAYDDVLRGADVPAAESLVDSLLHIPPAGRNIRMALDATLQQTATRLMDGHQGAVVLLELTSTDGQPTAEIRAMVSQPWYDPAELDALFADLGDESVSFFNRSTQGQYQPGLVLFPLLAARAIDDGIIDPAGAVEAADRAVGIDGMMQRCLTAPEGDSITWLDAVRGLCPGSAADLGELMGRDALADAFKALGLTVAPAIPIPTAEVANLPLDDLAATALGQATLTVSPLQVALAYGTLADGQLPSPRLVDAVRSTTGQWVPAESPAAGSSEVALTPSSATWVRRAFLTADGLSEVSVPVLSAPDGQMNDWFVGMAPSEDPRYVVAVVLEQPADAAAAERIGRELLAQAQAQP